MLPSLTRISTITSFYRSKDDVGFASGHRECSKPALAFFARPEIEIEVALRDHDVEKQGPVDAGPCKMLPTVRND